MRKTNWVSTCGGRLIAGGHVRVSPRNFAGFRTIGLGLRLGGRVSTSVQTRVRCVRTFGRLEGTTAKELAGGARGGSAGAGGQGRQICRRTDRGAKGLPRGL